MSRADHLLPRPSWRTVAVVLLLLLVVRAQAAFAEACGCAQSAASAPNTACEALQTCPCHPAPAPSGDPVPSRAPPCGGCCLAGHQPLFDDSAAPASDARPAAFEPLSPEAPSPFATLVAAPAIRFEARGPLDAGPPATPSSRSPDLLPVRLE